MHLPDEVLREHLAETGVVDLRRAELDQVAWSRIWAALPSDHSGYTVANAVAADHMSLRGRAILTRLIVKGHASFSGAAFHGGLTITDSRFERDLVLARSSHSDISMPGIWVGGALDLQRSSIEGALVLPRAQIGGTLLLRDAVIGGRADLGGAHAAKCEAKGITVTGQLQLEDAVIDGALNLCAAECSGRLTLDRMTVGGRLRLDHGSFAEDVRLDRIAVADDSGQRKAVLLAERISTEPRSADTCDVAPLTSMGRRGFIAYAWRRRHG